MTEEELRDFETNIMRLSALGSAARPEQLIGGMPFLEAERRVIEKFQPNMKAFDEVKYFIMGKVRVYEKGQLEWATKQDNMTITEKVFGHSKVKETSWNIGPAR